MRHFIFAIASVSALVAGSVAFSAPASARDYPYCLQGRETGYPGDCSYQSYRQCQASASGRDAFCSVNPRAAYNQQNGWNRR